MSVFALSGPRLARFSAISSSERGAINFVTDARGSIFYPAATLIDRRRISRNTRWLSLFRFARNRTYRYEGARNERLDFREFLTSTYHAITGDKIIGDVNDYYEYDRDD